MGMGIMRYRTLFYKIYYFLDRNHAATLIIRYETSEINSLYNSCYDICGGK